MSIEINQKRSLMEKNNASALSYNFLSVTSRQLSTGSCFILYSSPHSFMSLIIGISVFPNSVSEYSTSSHFVLILSRLPKDMVADSDYIQGMLKNVQKLPAEVVVGKGNVYDNFLKLDFGLQENERAMFEWGCRQTYLALGNMMTSAVQIGIDSCPMEGFNKEKIEHVLSEAGIMDAEHFGISCMVAFGYRLNEPRMKTRQTADQVIQWV